MVGEVLRIRGLDREVTVLVWGNQTVRARFDFTADRPLDDAGVRAVMDEVAKVVGAKK